jgi:hypothetical protein
LVSELTAGYGNFMLGPRRGPEVCDTCFNLTRGYERCYACAHGHASLDAMVPISYSIGGEQLHHVLASYKRLPGRVPRRFTVELAAVLWRFVAAHEACVSNAAGTTGFGLVTTVPSSNWERDAHHPLREIVGTLAAPTRGRFERVLVRAPTPSATRTFDPTKYTPTRPLDGEAVLLIDDTWTTGANAQSAAAALKAAGAATVAAVVIGRHLNREWHQNDRRLRRIPRPFDWEHCALCAPCPRGVD